MTAPRRIYRDSKGHFRKRTIQEGALELADKLFGDHVNMKPSAQIPRFLEEAGTPFEVRVSIREGKAYLRSPDAGKALFEKLFSRKESAK